MKQTLSILAFGLFSALAVAASLTPAPVRAEIDALLAKLGSSGCQFDRNGTWYNSTEARDHLRRKLEYVEGKVALPSAEQFIELAASKSSSSGKPYHVKCGSESAIESQQWLNRQLVIIRASVKGKP